MDDQSVLIVGNDPQASRAMQRLLEVEGFPARCAHTLAEARKAIASQLPKFLLLDLLLIDGDGSRLIDMLRDSETHKTRIAVMVGSVDLPASHERKLTDADTVLVKPFRPEQLFRWMADR